MDCIQTKTVQKILLTFALCFHCFHLTQVAVVLQRLAALLSDVVLSFLIPWRGRFICPLAVAGLGFKYLSINFTLTFGHPSRNPFRTALSIVEIFGLHKDWCANFTAFTLVLIECVNPAIDWCGAPFIQGPGRGRVAYAYEYASPSGFGYAYEYAPPGPTGSVTVGSGLWREYRTEAACIFTCGPCAVVPGVGVGTMGRVHRSVDGSL